MNAKENDYLNDPTAWLKSQSKDAPLSLGEIMRVQKEIDSIIGTTRGGKSIIKLVWCGDVRFWEKFYIGWDNDGKPTRQVSRPLLLHKSIWSNDRKQLIRDVFVPRWLLLRRSEPEQYFDTWEKFSYMRSAKHTKLEFVDTPVGKILQSVPQKILFRPPVPPADGWYRWFETVGDHTDYCCAEKAARGANCYGNYAHPRASFGHLESIAAARESAADNPFDAPCDIAQKHIERGNHNYFEQTRRAMENERDVVLENPELFAPLGLIEQGASLNRLRAALRENSKREIEAHQN